MLHESPRLMRIRQHKIDRELLDGRRSQAYNCLQKGSAPSLINWALTLMRVLSRPSVGTVELLGAVRSTCSSIASKPLTRWHNFQEGGKIANDLLRSAASDVIFLLSLTPPVAL